MIYFVTIFLQIELTRRNQLFYLFRASSFIIRWHMYCWYSIDSGEKLFRNVAGSLLLLLHSIKLKIVCDTVISNAGKRKTHFENQSVFCWETSFAFLFRKCDENFSLKCWNQCINHNVVQGNFQGQFSIRKPAEFW